MSARPKVSTMVTEFPDGIVVGWTHCARPNGGCGKHVNQCTCTNGPHEPRVFQQWRDEEKPMPAYKPVQEDVDDDPAPSSPPPAAAPKRRAVRRPT